MVASSAMSPIMMRTGSPGTMLSMKNVMAEMQRMMPTACNSRFTRKSLMVLLSHRYKKGRLPNPCGNRPGTDARAEIV